MLLGTRLPSDYFIPAIDNRVPYKLCFSANGPTCTLFLPSPYPEIAKSILRRRLRRGKEPDLFWALSQQEAQEHFSAFRFRRRNEEFYAKRFVP